jgi:hypothetical protein
MSESQGRYGVRWSAGTRMVPTPDLSRDWFADEVAIDFPAVDAAMARMRDTFVGREEGDTLQAELRLSPREALDGVVIPLAVPVRRTCGPCGGRGETWTEPCAACGGTGHASVPHHVRLAIPAGLTDGDSFSFRISMPQALTTRVDIRIAVR